jgi:hypothetical protein
MNPTVKLLTLLAVNRKAILPVIWSTVLIHETINSGAHELKFINAGRAYLDFIYVNLKGEYMRSVA